MGKDRMLFCYQADHDYCYGAKYYKDLWLSERSKNEVLKKVNKEYLQGIERLKRNYTNYKKLYKDILPEYQKMQQDILNLQAELLKINKRGAK